MLALLKNRTYRHVFLAKVIALVGTGFDTVALGLPAYDTSGDDAGAVLGAALAIKMVAYVAIAPLFVALDMIRAAVAICLPFVTEVWQVYVRVFPLQSASATFMPAFQATILDVLPEEKDCTRALSPSCLAYNLESVASPILAAALLALMSFHNLFAGTIVGFPASGALVASVFLPSPKANARCGIYDPTTRGMRIYLASPRLRALLALGLAVSAPGWLGASIGLSAAFAALALIAAIAVAVATRIRPAGAPDELAHAHEGLAPDHPHLHGIRRRHSHVFVIDSYHPEWPCS